MKKITYVIALAAITILISCKNDSKSSETTDLTDTTEVNIDSTSIKNETDNKTDIVENTGTDNDHTNKKNKRTYIVLSDSTFVKWTAYKTTSKIGVGAEFTTINFKNRKGGTIAEAYNGLEFSIPVSSIKTNDEARDQTIIKSFFNVLSDTKEITGKLNFDADDLCTTTITMNGITKKVHLSYFAAENEVNFTADINLEDWDATGAIENLNKVCDILHRGEDGISKTWSDVAIHITTKY